MTPYHSDTYWLDEIDTMQVVSDGWTVPDVGLKRSENDGAGRKEPTPTARYYGEWQDDHPHGSGRLEKADGSAYLGGWGAGKYHGAGFLTYADKSKYVGRWDMGKQVASSVLLADGMAVRDE
jgi:hypothetical protein